MPAKPSLILMCLPWLCCFVFVLSCSAEVDFGSDTILQGQQLRDSEFLTSANKAFTLRFFSPGTSKEHRYLGIFHQSLSRSPPDVEEKPIWIANRDEPIRDGSGALTVNATDGMLTIINSGGDIIILPNRTPNWSSAGYNRNINTSATLRDDGNLVLSRVYPNGSTNGSILWQSFDYPTDTLLPGMKLGNDLKTGQRWSLTSWTSDGLPSSGSFTLGMDDDTNRLMIWWHKNVYWTSWMLPNDPFAKSSSNDHQFINYKYISNENGSCYYTFSQADGLYTAIRLAPSGKVVVIPQGIGLVHCESYMEDPHSGCAEYSFEKCIGKDTFSRWNADYNNISNSKYSTVVDNAKLSIFDCEVKCKQSCSCYGYASLNEDGTGCEFWDKETVASIVAFGNEGEKLMYVVHTVDQKKYWTWIVAAAAGLCLLVISILVLVRNCGDKVNRIESINFMLGELADTTTHSGIQTFRWKTWKQKKHKLNHIYQFSIDTIEIATNSFSSENKLGEGGFGVVYKGKLLDGQEIAVKRLSRSSRQGIDEFKNEIQLIAKLQHNNLVRLLGCCIQQEEMILVYEYMPNKSLDSFLFDPEKQGLLKWTNRMNIIEGIAQGILYLHKHSRLKVIHRDLKAGNILLDLNMTPKISDFGMARIFGMQDSEANTKRIVGTHGYMSPEYAISGVFSTKTDVFSFGVLVLEIISGKKNHRSYHSDRPLNLIGLAWELWDEGRVLDLLDRTMDVLNHVNEVTRCINIGLLCVQAHASERPSMSDVIIMMKNESLQLPTPKQPAFFIETITTDRNIEEGQENISTNKLSTSIMEAR